MHTYIHFKPIFACLSSSFVQLFTIFKYFFVYIRAYIHNQYIHIHTHAYIYKHTCIERERERERERLTIASPIGQVNEWNKWETIMTNISTNAHIYI